MKKHYLVICIVFQIFIMPLKSIGLNYHQKFNFLLADNLVEIIDPNTDKKDDVLFVDIAIASFYNFLKAQSTISGPYLGQKLPGITPKLFAKGLISNDEMESNICFADNGKRIYVEQIIHSQSVIKLFTMDDKGWQDKLISNISDMAIGDRMENNYYRLLSDEKVLEDTVDLYGNLLIAPDKSYCIFSRRNKGDNYYKLTISFRHSNGNWCSPINLSEILKTPKLGDEKVCTLSPDGKYLFYIVDGDIFWVETKITNIVKPTNYK